MSGVGGFNPLPIRLGGNDATTSWTAEDYAAICRDLLAASRVTPFAHLKLSYDFDADTASITHYRGINGVGLDYAPELELILATIYLTWPAEWEDETGIRRQINITAANSVPASPEQGWSETTITQRSGRRSVKVLPTGMDPSWLSSGAIQVTVWGSYMDGTVLSDYGCSSDKTNCQTEIVPYALSQYRALQDARGSAYSRETGTLVHVENLAIARAHAATWRRSERLACNANPATANEKASDWQTVLGVRRHDGDTDATIRTRNAAKLKAALGPTRRTVDDAVSDLLGPLYVRTWRNYSGETISDDSGTYWPGINPGAPSRDLGGGPWYSDREHIVIEVLHPASLSEHDFAAKMTDLTELLDLMLPATCTFDWVTGADDGFTLDEDLLDEGCLGG